MQPGLAPSHSQVVHDTVDPLPLCSSLIILLPSTPITRLPTSRCIFLNTNLPILFKNLSYWPVLYILEQI